MPSYLVAKISEQTWEMAIDQTFEIQLKTVFLLIDIRHAPGENDIRMYDWIKANGFEPVIIATKADKIKRSQIDKCLKVIRETLEVEKGTVMIPFSAETKQGREEVYELLEKLLSKNEESEE